jgi:hypothetical protein
MCTAHRRHLKPLSGEEVHSCSPGKSEIVRPIKSVGHYIHVVETVGTIFSSFSLLAFSLSELQHPPFNRN